VKRQKLMRIDTPPELRQDVLAAARRMRRQPTRSEALLWQALRGKQLDGIKFHRQQLLEAIGLRVLRIPDALVENELPEALKRIRSACVQHIAELP
jgi:very-short-patch-repair endonuclease